MDEVPALDDYLNRRTPRDYLEIQFIEVATDMRRRCIGRDFVELLGRHYGGRRLVALSEGADKFWAAMGWDRIDHREGPQWRRPLFVAPS